MERLLSGARWLRERAGGERVWAPLRPAYWTLLSLLTRRSGVGLRLADGARYRLDARLFAWQPHEYEPGVVGTLLGELSPDGVFVDVGAHVGLLSLVAARRTTAGAGRVYAIEPSPANVELLRRHIAMNGFDDRVVVVQALAGDRPRASVGFTYRPGQCTANSLAYDIGDGRRVDLPMITIDALVVERGLPAPQVIKIDVEGYEHHVLQGARSVLAAGAPVVICAIHPEPLEKLGTSAERVLSDMRAWGYEAFDIDGRAVESAGFQDVVFRKAL